MPGPFGVTNQGFNPMRLSDVLAANTADFQAALGPAIDLSADTPLGQINGILSEREALLWQGLEDLNLQQNPDNASGLNQDNLYAINNLTRLPAIPSTDSWTVTGTPGTTVEGTDTSSTPLQVSVTGTDHTVVFQATQTAVIGAGGNVTVTAACTQDGPVPAAAGTCTVIETPTTGIASVTNAGAVEGRNLETDTEFRIRRLNELQRSQAGTNQGILDTVAQVAGVLQSGIIENDTDFTDMGTGLPPHSFEVFAIGGADAAIAAAIFASKAAGIQTYGGTTVVVTDSQGYTHNISFSRPTQVVLNLIVNITQDLDPADGQPFPVGGAAQAQAALVAYGAVAQLGQDVVNVALLTAVMNAVSGIAQLQILQAVYPAVPVVSTNIAIGPTQIMNIVAGNINVNVI